MNFATLQVQPDEHPRWHHRHLPSPEVSAIKLIASSMLFLVLFALFVVRPWYKKRRRAKERVTARGTSGRRVGKHRRRT